MVKNASHKSLKPCIPRLPYTPYPPPPQRYMAASLARVGRQASRQHHFPMIKQRSLLCLVLSFLKSASSSRAYTSATALCRSNDRQASPLEFTLTLSLPFALAAALPAGRPSVHRPS